MTATLTFDQRPGGRHPLAGRRGLGLSRRPVIDVSVSDAFRAAQLWLTLHNRDRDIVELPWVQLARRTGHDADTLRRSHLAHVELPWVQLARRTGHDADTLRRSHLAHVDPRRWVADHVTDIGGTAEVADHHGRRARGQLPLISEAFVILHSFEDHRRVEAMVAVSELWALREIRAGA